MKPGRSRGKAISDSCWETRTGAGVDDQPRPTKDSTLGFVHRQASVQLEFDVEMRNEKTRWALGPPEEEDSFFPMEIYLLLSIVPQEARQGLFNSGAGARRGLADGSVGT